MNAALKNLAGALNIETAALLIAISTILLASMLPARANVVTLECGAGGGVSTDHGNFPAHHIYEIDYSASTVRAYAVTDDGARYGNVTNRAEISDNTISWWCDKARNLYCTLGRYTGTLRMTNPEQQINLTESCHVWAPPRRQKQF